MIVTTVSVTVFDPNQAPVANPDAATVAEDAGATPRANAVEHQTGGLRRALITPVLKPSQCMRPR